jgi:hypothetical protein
MANNHIDDETAAAAAAMSRVLEAERHSEQSVADCERQAQALREAAYARARGIASRTDGRISLLRTRSSERLDREIDAMERAEQAAQQEPSPEPPQAARVTAVVEELATELSGGAARVPSDGEGGT